MIRVADFVAQSLARAGIRDVFLVTGGGAMHLNDAIGRCRELRYTCCHHEQACAMAAEGYFRQSGRMAAVNVTTGPGGTNAITGVFGAFTDSIPMVVVSGNVRFDTTVRSAGLPLRQLGDQELDIVRLVEPVTKYAVMVVDPVTIRYHLEKALFLATHLRPGPVWIDVPMNVQGAFVEEEALVGFDPAAEGFGAPPEFRPEVAAEIRERVANAERPVVLVGNGVRLADRVEKTRELISKWGIPAVTAFNGQDVVPNDHPFFVGRQGWVGDRAGNFAVQSSDLLLVLGSRLPLRQVGYDWKSFARAAFRIVVDIDGLELRKPTLRVDLPVEADLRDVVDRLLALPEVEPERHRKWVAWCLARKERYPVVLPSYWAKPAPVNPYCFVDRLSAALADGDTVVTGDGTACVATFQAARLRAGQRLFSNGGSAPMGFDLPGAVGAAVAARGSRIVCLAGDGSLQMNLQELQTVATHRLPIKLFVWNNGGYHSIRQTQMNFFPDSPIGFDAASGVGLPDFRKLAAVWEFPFERATRHDELDGAIARTLAGNHPSVCEIVLDISQPFSPKPSSKRLPDGRMVSAPLEDLAPFLPREELLENLLIPPLPEA